MRLFPNLKPVDEEGAEAVFLKKEEDKKDRDSQTGGRTERKRTGTGCTMERTLYMVCRR